MIGEGWMAAATVSSVPGHYVPEKLVRLDDTGAIVFVHPDGNCDSNRQSAARCYARNGLCYAARRAAVVDRLEIVERDCAGVLGEEFSPNIDEPIDLKIADWWARTQQRNDPEHHLGDRD
jgi:CMP-N-acetylneuraminic acid synthetase